MKAREYLNLLIEENPTDEHSAALRELDSLLSEAVKVLRSDSTYCHCKSEPCIMFELTKKFQQAGY